MIPKIIHYCWFGGNSIPDAIRKYMASWKRFMPDWEIKEWNESNCDIAAAPVYVQEAYACKKYAFVSDYYRLVALKKCGGVYFDTDVEVLKSFEPLLNDTAFIGFEESKAHLPGTCVFGCEADCAWVNDMLAIYDGLKFVMPDGSFDMITNVQRMGEKMVSNGLIANGQPQYIEKWGLRVYPFDYFSPLTSTRVLRVSENTYSIHHFASSWHDAPTFKSMVVSFICDKIIGREIADKLIKMKRKVVG